MINFSAANKNAKILIVEDDRTARLHAITLLEKDRYDILEAENGEEALEIIKREGVSLDAILLDREMPKMNGIQFIKELRKIPKVNKLPVIMVTGHDKPEQIEEAIASGVFFFLSKPVNKEVLNTITDAAVRESIQRKRLSKEIEKHKVSFSLIEACQYKFQTLPEAESLAGFISNIFPDPERSLVGIAALLVNAVEHGSFGLSYEDKTELLANNSWREELLKRAELPENKHKFVQVKLWKEPKGIYMKIDDMGKGFEYQKYMNMDASRANDNHGRGIAQANLVSFDALRYNEVGNSVTAFVEFEKGLNW